MKKVNVGIDLGNTNAVVAAFNKETGEIELLKNSHLSYITPCAVCIEDRCVTIGIDAWDERAAGNKNASAFYRSFIGNPHYFVCFDGEEYSAEDLTTVFLKHLIEDIELTNDVRIEAAVITVPACFGSKEKTATLRACRRAGLNVLSVVSEQMAAITASGLVGNRNGRVLVYDLGGTTFEATVAEINGSKVNILAVNGNDRLGGNDWDHVIVAALSDMFMDEFGIDPVDSSENFAKLCKTAGMLKMKLTTQKEVSAILRFDGFVGRYRITREQFESMGDYILEMTAAHISQCFDEIGNGFGWHSVDEVLLVGGATRMPQIAEYVKRETGRPHTEVKLPPDALVAAGAAEVAGLYSSIKI